MRLRRRSRFSLQYLMLSSFQVNWPFFFKKSFSLFSLMKKASWTTCRRTDVFAATCNQIFANKKEETHKFKKKKCSQTHNNSSVIPQSGLPSLVHWIVWTPSVWLALPFDWTQATCSCCFFFLLFFVFSCHRVSSDCSPSTLLKFCVHAVTPNCRVFGSHATSTPPPFVIFRPCCFFSS